MRKFQVYGAALNDGSDIVKIISAKDEKHARDICFLENIAVARLEDLGEPIDPGTIERETPPLSPVAVAMEKLKPPPAFTESELRAQAQARTQQRRRSEAKPSQMNQVFIIASGVCVGLILFSCTCMGSTGFLRSLFVDLANTVDQRPPPGTQYQRVRVGEEIEPGVRIKAVSFVTSPGHSGTRVEWTVEIENTSDRVAFGDLTAVFLDDAGNAVMESEKERRINLTPGKHAPTFVFYRDGPGPLNAKKIDSLIWILR